MVVKPCHFVVGLFHIYISQYWVLKQDVLWGLCWYRKAKTTQL